MKHECEAEKKGNTLILKCNLCPDFKGSLNLETGKIKFTGGSEEIKHFGVYVNPMGASGEN